MARNADGIGVMALGRPRIAPNVVQRNRIQNWLDFHASTAVRYLCAPAGSGKTTAVVLYARSRALPLRYVTLPAGADRAQLLGALARELGLCEPVGYRAIVEHLASAGTLEIAIDNVDDATDDARAVLADIFRDVPDGVTFIYLARAAGALALRGAQAQGLVDVCDPGLLAFDVTEIDRCAQQLGIADSHAAGWLHAATHGWATAVSGVLRAAAGNGLMLPDALRYWRRQSQTTLDEWVAQAAAAAGPELAAAFHRVLDGRDGTTPQRLEAFRGSGLFVGEYNGRLAINPLVGSHGADNSGDPACAVPAVIELFGRFEMSIAGRAVQFVRRRDREIVQYLALQPGGRATRAQLIAQFWPDADRQLAGQSLRSAASTIRRALAACVGRSNVERYFGGEHGLELRLHNADISTQRFAQLVEQADAAYLRGELATAFLHYCRATKLYRAPLLAGEPPAGWSAPVVERYGALYASATQRAVHLHDVRPPNVA